MRRSHVRRALSQLFARRETTDHERRAIEADVLSAYDRRYPDRSKPPGWAMTHRWAMGSVFGLIVAVGACRLPADYAVDMGSRLGIVIDAGVLGQLDPADIVNWVQQSHSLEQLMVSVDREGRDGGGAHVESVRIRLAMVGQDVEIDADALWEQLQQEFPVLRQGARLEEEQLEATVHGTLGGKLSHEVLDWVIDRHGVEEARLRVLEELHARGLSGDAQIVVHDDGTGRHRVEVRVRAERRENEP